MWIVSGKQSQKKFVKSFGDGTTVLNLKVVTIMHIGCKWLLFFFLSLSQKNKINKYYIEEKKALSLRWASFGKVGSGGSGCIGQKKRKRKWRKANTLRKASMTEDKRAPGNQSSLRCCWSWEIWRDGTGRPPPPGFATKPGTPMALLLETWA